MYVAILEALVAKAAANYQIDLAPPNIATDFELASINAFKEVFPAIIVTGCHFHLGQSVLRKVNEMGLKTRYRSDPEYSLHARMLYGLAYLPVDDVVAGLEAIRSSMPAAGQPLVEYFDRTYVNGPLLRRTAANTLIHRPPVFPPTLWNVADRFDSQLPTTTNYVEAWHRQLQALIVVDHPSFYSCLHQLKQEQQHTQVAVMRNDNGYRVKPKRRSMTEHVRRLTTLRNDLHCARKDIRAFLRGVAHSFGRHTWMKAEGTEEGEGLDNVDGGGRRNH